MDLEITQGNLRLKVRANGIIINEGKVLACTINDNAFWCLPGGHIHLGEDSQTAALREIEEEVGVKFENAQICFIMENFFVGKHDKEYHEIDFYYLMQGEIPKEKLVDRVIQENDEGKLVRLEFKWLEIDKLDEFDFRPKPLVNLLKSKDFSLKHIIKNEI